MTQETEATSTSTRPGLIVLGAVYFFYFAVFIRTLALEVIRPRLPVYLALEVLYLVLFTWMLWRPVRQPLWQHLYFAFQSLLVLALLSLRFKFDFIVVLFVLLSFQSAVVYQGLARWVWVAILTLLTCIPLMISLGALPGLAVALLPMTVGIVFPAYVTVTQEVDAGLNRSQVLLTDLEAVNQKLTVYAGQVEELAAIQERSRLARKLHDSVSQTIFSISLHTRAAQILLERDPTQLRPQLEQLQSLSQSALIEMRGLITHLRPPQG